MGQSPVPAKSQRESDMPHLWQHLWRKPCVLFVTSEMVPLVKTGGLADVAYALPAALSEFGCDVRVLLPAYRVVKRAAGAQREIARAHIGGFDVAILETVLASGLPVWLLDCTELYDRPGGPYQDETGTDWSDNAERFALLSRAVSWLALARLPEFTPNVVHLNDWPTGLAAALLSRERDRPRIVFSIHNLEYQGLFDGSVFERLGLPTSLWSPEALEFYDKLSFMKGGLVFADALTTVSPSYAREIQTPEYGFGLDGLLRHRADRLRGILNGIDMEAWNPATDPYLPAHFDVDDLAGKARCRTALRSALDLRDERVPLVAVVSRFAAQKGMDLVLDAVDRLCGVPVQLAVLGGGAPELEAGFAAARDRHPGMVGYVRGFDERLAHLIEAGADLFLMPSRFEPCGLSQMYSMRYGTVPVVRRTGGLADTVEPVHGAHAGSGFLFDEPTSEALLAAVRGALTVYADAARWRAIQREGMTRDFSWARSAQAYRDLYVDVLAGA